MNANETNITTATATITDRFGALDEVTVDLGYTRAQLVRLWKRAADAAARAAKEAAYDAAAAEFVGDGPDPLLAMLLEAVAK